MTSRWATAVFASTIGLIAACQGAAPSSSRVSLSPIPPSPPILPSPPTLPSPPAPVPPGLSEGSAPAASAPDETCPATPPKLDAAFMSLTLRFQEGPDETTTVAPDVARRFPAISDDGRRLAILDERDNVEEGASLHLALLDVRTQKLEVFTLFAASGRPLRRREAQQALDQARWQSLVPAETGRDDCGVANGDEAPALHFGADEVEFVDMRQTVELLLRTRSGETKVAIVPHGLPGTLGQAAVPTGDVGASCGLWDHLDAGWVSQDGKVYLFKLGASLGGRCGPAPTPVEYASWLSR